MAIILIFMTTQQNKISPLPYPLSRSARLTIMLTLFGIFLLATPLVILYARGYTYDFATHSVFHGGAISIETEPSDAQVFVNNILMKQTSPVEISHVLPGNYTIRIEGKNSIPWQKDINIRSNETLYLHDIDLFAPNNKKLLLDKNIDQSFESHKGEFFVFSKHHNDTYELFLYEYESQLENLLTRIITTSTPIIEQSRKNDLIRIEYMSQGSKNVLLMNPQNPFISQSDTNSIAYQWIDGKNGTSYISQQNDSLHRLTINASETLFTLSSSTVAWFIDEQNSLWEFSDNTIRKYKDAKVSSSYPVLHPLTKFIDINEKRVVATNGENIFVYTFETPSTVRENMLPVSNFTLNQDQNSLLAWKDGELWTIHPDGNANLINRFSENIKKVIPFTSEGTLLLVMEKKLVAFHPKYFIPQELLSGDSIESVNVDAKKRMLYVFGVIDGVKGVWGLGY